LQLRSIVCTCYAPPVCVPAITGSIPTVLASGIFISAGTAAAAATSAAAVTFAAAATSYIGLSSTVVAGTSAVGTTLPSHDPGGQVSCSSNLLLYPATPASLLLSPRALLMLLDEVESQKLLGFYRSSTWLLRMPISI
jgi:hypothetical protein